MCFGLFRKRKDYIKNSKKYIEEARKIVANKLNSLPEEIFFTSGGTESDNWAIKSIAFETPEIDATFSLENAKLNVLHVINVHLFVHMLLLDHIY